MAVIVFNRGLLRIGQQAFQSTNYNVARHIQTLSVDDSSVAFAAGDTALDSGGAVSNEFDKAFDATPTENAQTITIVCTLDTGEGNFTIRRIALHDDTTANVSASSSTVVSGVDGQSLTKTNDFSMEITLGTALTDNS